MGEYLAIESISPALHRTGQAFWPPHPGKWARLLIISFFIGAWFTSPFPDLSLQDLPLITSLPYSDELISQAGLVTSVLTAMLLLLLVFALFSSVFQFILVDYLSSKQNGLLASFTSRIGFGIRLLGFYLATIVLMGLLAFLLILIIAVPVLSENPDNPAQFLSALVMTLLALLVLILPVWIATLITTDFVVPVMIVRSCGIIRGWKIIFRELSGRWDEAAVYLGVKIIINIVTGVVLGLLMVLISGLFNLSSLALVPGLSEGMQVVPTELIGPFLMIGMITLVVMTPVVTFLRYYALIFLEKISTSYSLLPDVFQGEPCLK